MNNAEAVMEIDNPTGIVTETDQYLTFMLADEEYGVDILRVQEIKGWSHATPIPNTPDFVKGVINMRGTIVPIVDLRERFSMPEAAYGPTTVVVVLKVVGTDDSERTMGIVVDAVSDVYNVATSDIKPTPNFGGNIDVEFLKGLATIDEKMVILLDIDKLLNQSVIPEMEAAPEAR